MAREASEYSDEFDAFFDKHYPAMIRSLTLISGDSEVAADAVQDAFIRAYAKWNRIRRYDRPDAWVRRVAINRTRDHFRASARRRNYEGAAARPDDVASAESQTDNRDLIRQALRELPHRQRTAITLYYLEGLDTRSVAQSMKISIGAVKFHLSKGRANLQPIVGEKTVGEEVV